MERPLLPPRLTLLLVVLAAAAVALATSGCQMNTGGNLPDRSLVFQGNDGLILSFFKDAPPEVVFASATSEEPSTVPIAILVENKGAFNIDCISPDKDCGYFGIQANKNYFEMNPAFGKLKDALGSSGEKELLGTESYLSGGRAAVDVTATIKDPGKSTPTQITVAACYPYKTFLSASVCIESAHYTVEEARRTCKPSLLSLQDQGAPVAVKRVEYDSLPVGSKIIPRFKIFVQNAGNGFIIDENSLEAACTATSQTEEDILGKVFIEEATISGRPLNCQGKSVTISGPKDFIDCRLESSQAFDSLGNNFVSPLKVTLRYGYYSAVSKPITIEVFDTPPKIIRMYATPSVPKGGGEEAEVTVIAEDDTGIESIVLDSGEKQECEGKVRCEKTFKVSTAEAGKSITYRASAIDVSSKPSKEEPLIITSAGITLLVIKDAGERGRDITITAVASKENVIRSLRYFDGTTRKELGNSFCGGTTICTRIFHYRPKSGEPVASSFIAAVTFKNDEVIEVNAANIPQSSASSSEASEGTPSPTPGSSPTPTSSPTPAPVPEPPAAPPASQPENSLNEECQRKGGICITSAACSSDEDNAVDGLCEGSLVCCLLN